MINPSDLDLASLPWLPLEARSSFPRQPVIYFAIDSQGAIQYIGRSVDLRVRWTTHHRYEELAAIGGVRIAYLFVEASSLLPEIELALIEWFQPALNGRLVVTKKPRVSLYIEDSVKQDLERLAKLRKRSLNNLVELLCEEAIREAKKTGELSKGEDDE